MKAIRIDDEQYSRLVYLAKQDDRSVTKYLYKLLDKEVGGGSSSTPEPLENKVPSPDISKKISDLPRDKEIVNEIKLLQIDIELADVDNQDPDYWQSINEKKAKITALWNEWHEVTGR